MWHHILSPKNDAQNLNKLYISVTKTSKDAWNYLVFQFLINQQSSGNLWCCSGTKNVLLNSNHSICQRNIFFTYCQSPSMALIQNMWKFMWPTVNLVFYLSLDITIFLITSTLFKTGNCLKQKSEYIYIYIERMQLTYRCKQCNANVQRWNKSASKCHLRGFASLCELFLCQSIHNLTILQSYLPLLRYSRLRGQSKDTVLVYLWVKAS